MNIETLIKEAERLSRPVTYLVPTRSQHQVGVWWGAKPDPRLRSTLCWFTLDCSATSSLGIRSGFLIVHTDSMRINGSATIFGEMPLLATTGGQPLYGVPGRSLPPIDALFRFGSDEIGTWLEHCGWRRDCEYNDNFPDPVAQQYEQIYQGQHPLYTETAWAAVGGWHFPWPDGDWEERLNDKLLVTTYHDSEPWLEVWEMADRELRVITRIT